MLYDLTILKIDKNKQIHTHTHKSAEIIEGRNLFKGGNYLQKYGMLFEAANINRFPFPVQQNVQVNPVRVWQWSELA